MILLASGFLSLGHITWDADSAHFMTGKNGPSIQKHSSKTLASIYSWYISLFLLCNWLISWKIVWLCLNVWCLQYNNTIRSAHLGKEGLKRRKYAFALTWNLVLSSVPNSHALFSSHEIQEASTLVKQYLYSFYPRFWLFSHDIWSNIVLWSCNLTFISSVQ